MSTLLVKALTGISLVAGLVSPSLAAAEQERPGCNYNRSFQVTLADGREASGHICWQDRYFVSGYGIARNTVEAFKQPTLVVGNQDFKLEDSRAEFWCKAMGKEYKIRVDSSQRLFGITVATTAPSRETYETHLQLIRARSSQFAGMIYCSDQFYLLEMLAIRQYAERHQLNIWNVNRLEGSGHLRLPPLRLRRQE